MKKRISFIINPISGGLKKDAFPGLVEQTINSSLFDYELHFTKSAEHNLELASQSVEEKADIIAAVGGDGTINHVAKHLVDSNIPLAIIPFGSGNGFARHLGIPMNPKKALELINLYKVMQVDSGMANDIFFMNVAGAGFDAHISKMFAEAESRGFSSYIKLTLKEFAAYKPSEYDLVIDGETKKLKAFIICIANGSQYGNNAWIAPTAKLSDGKFQITVLNPFRMYQVPIIAWQLFAKHIDRSVYTTCFEGKEILLKRPEAGVFNIDGEPVMMEKDIKIRMMSNSLQVIVP